MKIVFISDMHGNFLEEIPTGDMVVFCGDLTRHGKEEDVLEFAEYLRKLPFKYKIVVAGNHDWFFEENHFRASAIIEETGAHYLCDSGVTIEGIRFWGSPVQPRFFDWAFNRERGDEISKHWDMIPKGTDVLITHGPPWGILDKNAKGQSCGCADLLRKVLEIKPRVHAFGHIHEGYGRVESHGTLFVNASVLDGNYQDKNEPVVVDL